jgi:hypothetical protein
MMHEQISLPQSDPPQPASFSDGAHRGSVPPGPVRPAERRMITLAEAIQICDEIRRKDERRRQEILDREARIAMELDLPG